MMECLHSAYNKFPVSLPVNFFSKSVKIWQSYCQSFGGLFFGTRCSLHRIDAKIEIRISKKKQEKENKERIETNSGLRDVERQ